MHYKKFGNTDSSISEIGLGTWQIGGSWGDVPDDEALNILHKAVDEGVNFFDTADVYGDGRSEQLIGKFLKDTSADIFVATKIGRWSEPGWPQNFSLETMRRHVEASLKRLGVEALDLVQLHCIPTEELRKGEVFEHLRTLIAEGKIKRYGVSVESMEEALICLEQPDLTSLQIIFNIFRQKPMHTLFDKAAERNIGLIARVPLASGLLSGKMSKDSTFSSSDHRNFNRDGAAFNVGETFAGLPFDKGVELADEIKKLTPEGMTMPQMALRWILDFPTISTVIPGASSTEQVAANTSASSLPPLGDELHKKLTEMYESSIEAHIRGPY